MIFVVAALPSPVPGEVVRLLDDLAAVGASTAHLQPMPPDEVSDLAADVLGAPPGALLTGLLAKAG